MLTLSTLLTADLESPLQCECGDCDGAGTVKTQALRDFLLQYGSPVLAACQSASQAARAAAGIRQFEVAWIPGKQQLVGAGLDDQTASSYHELLKAGSSVACSHCDGTGMVLSDFGQALQTLRSQLDRLDSIVNRQIGE